jgi:hypothetical protein
MNPIGRGLVTVAAILASESDGSQALFSWPNWKVQQLALIGGLPVGVLFIAIGLLLMDTHAVASAAWLVGGTVVLAGTLYVGVSTAWLQVTRDVGPLVKAVSAVCLTLNGVCIVAVILFGGYWIIIGIVTLLLIGLILVLASPKQAPAQAASRCAACGRYMTGPHTCW